MTFLDFAFQLLDFTVSFATQKKNIKVCGHDMDQEIRYKNLSTNRLRKQSQTQSIMVTSMAAIHLLRTL